VTPRARTGDPITTRTTRSRGRAPTAAREQIGIKETEKRLALSRKQIQRDMEAGMPFDRQGTRLMFPWPDIRIWRDERIRELSARAAQPTGEDDWKKRKLAAEAELAELEVAQMRGALIPVEEFHRHLETAFSRVRARLLSLPPKLGAAAVGHSTPREAQAALEPIIYEVMEELHRSDDIPPYDDQAQEELALATAGG